MSSNDNDASKAYAAVSAQLELWASPKKMSWRTYEDDAVQWMETSMGRDEPQGDTTMLTPQKRSSGDSPPGTPVMSNSAKKMQPSPLNLSEVPVLPPPLVSNDTYCLYHDALLHHVQEKQLLQHRMQDVDCAQEIAVDVEYFTTLAIDSKLWSLLAKLRSLGIDSLWMEDSRREQIAISDTLARLSNSTASTTPAHLIQNLFEEKTSPLLLQRRKALLEWMEECAAQDKIDTPRRQDQMWPDSNQALRQGMQRRDKISSIHPDAPLLVSESGEPLFGKDNKSDEELLQACLGHILAGRLDKATELCNSQGQPWRSAAWQGGRPFEISSYPDDKTKSMLSVTTGNPQRILWKAQCRKLAQATRGVESAIYAILANDMNNALANPALRTWERSLYVCMSSMVGRMEDELLHRYHTQLRKHGRVFPGSDYEQQELEHLLATANVARWNETSIFETLQASPYNEVKGRSLVQQVMAAFIQGKVAVRAFLRSPWFKDADDAHLRCMTHLLVYLDSLPNIQIEGLSHIKEDCLLEYLRHLTANPDLVRFSTMYASILPTQTMLSVFPSLLINVQVPEERNRLWNQMHELFEEGICMDVLQSIVRLVLGNTDFPDVRKCQALGWLCLTPKHYGPALVCANELVRQLLLNDKTSVASQFLWEYFPTIVKEDTYEEFVSAKREHDALLLYLEANTAFDLWKDSMMDTAYESAPGKLDMNKFNEAEKEIARSMDKRRLVEEKRKLAQSIIEVANAAQGKLEEMLTFEGGWLQEYEDDDDLDTDEEIRRQAELERLQGRIIPQAVFMAHNVDTETAKWMKAMLEDAVPIVGKDTKEVLNVLDSAEHPSLSLFSPLYWLKHAHSLANKVASEEYSVYDAFGQNDLKHFLQLMEDVTISVLEEEAQYS